MDKLWVTWAYCNFRLFVWPFLSVEGCVMKAGFYSPNVHTVFFHQVSYLLVYLILKKDSSLNIWSHSSENGDSGERWSRLLFASTTARIWANKLATMSSKCIQSACLEVITWPVKCLPCTWPIFYSSDTHIYFCIPDSNIPSGCHIWAPLSIVLHTPQLF